MSKLATIPTGPSIDGLERVLLEGDLGGLSQEQRVKYYSKVCESVGLNPLTQPFEYLKLQGKTILYAKRGATDQLRQIHKVSVTISSRERMDDIYVVTARATTPDGRCDESIGAVPLKGLQGEALANALMKGETKAKRRVTLAICGLSMLDETEVASIQEPAKLPGKPVRTLDQLAAEGEQPRPFVATVPSATYQTPVTATTAACGTTATTSGAQSAKAATDEVAIDTFRANEIVCGFNDGLKATCELAGLQETGEVDQWGLMVPPGECPRFSARAKSFANQSYLDAPAGFIRDVILADPRFGKEPAEKQLWANYAVAVHECKKAMGGSK